jgi:F0F1-type ATP synthase assembly protein I
MTDRIPDGTPEAGPTGGPADSAPGGASPEEQDSASIPPAAAGSEQSPGQAFAQVLRQAAPFLGAASLMTGAVLLGVLGGRWLDDRLGTQPWLLLTGALIGVGVGLRQVAVVALGRRRDGP